MADDSNDDAHASAKPKRGPRAAKPENRTAETAEGAPVVAALKKKDLLERVQALTKAKKKDVKDVVETTLQVLGEALAKGEELNLPPLGKAKVNRQKGVTGGDMYIIRLRRFAGKAAKAAKEDGETEALAAVEH